MTDAVKLERERRRSAREERLWRILEDPNVRRLGLLAGILAYGAYVGRQPDAGPVQTATAMGLTGVGIPLLAADAGITDKYALAIIAGLGLSYVPGVALYKEISQYGGGSDPLSLAKGLSDMAQAQLGNLLP